MKVTYEFTDEDQMNLEIFQKSIKLHSLISDLLRYLREEIKYKEDNPNKEILDDLRTKIFNDLTEEGLIHLFQ